LPSKAAYHHGNLKPALLAAALKEVAREGVDGFSLRGVARRAGVSAPAVYRHFKDKDDLLAAVAADAQQRLQAQIGEAHASAADNPLAKFRATGIAIVRFATAHPEHFRVLSHPGLVKKDDSYAEDRRQIQAAQVAGFITDAPVDAVMLAANALVTGLAHMIVEGQLGPVDDARATELATAVTHILGVGLVPRDEELDDAFDVVAVRAPKKRGVKR
jgi:AcrR family transcriptional regulator